jgi:hypothetical protein
MMTASDEEDLSYLQEKAALLDVHADDGILSETCTESLLRSAACLPCGGQWAEVDCGLYVLIRSLMLSTGVALILMGVSWDINAIVGVGAALMLIVAVFMICESPRVASCVSQRYCEKKIAHDVRVKKLAELACLSEAQLLALMCLEQQCGKSMKVVHREWGITSVDWSQMLHRKAGKRNVN